MAANTGPIGGDLSHEFIILAETGESKIYSDKRICDIDINKHNSEESSIKDLRKKYDEFYAVTDDKFKKEDFEKSRDMGIIPGQPKDEISTPIVKIPYEQEIAEGGIAGQLHLNQGGRASFTKGGKVSSGLANILGV